MLQTSAVTHQIQPAAQGWAWLCEGWTLFRRNMGIWVAILIIWWLIDSVAASIPLLGMGAPLLTPVFTAGVLFGCDRLRRGDALDIGHLFTGFQTQFKPLLLIGVVYMLADLLGSALAATAAMAMGIGAVLAQLGQVDINHMNQLTALFNQFGTLLMVALPGIWAWMMVKLAVAAVVAIAFYFAPALVILGQRDAWLSIRQSWDAVAANWLSLTMYGVYYLGVGLLAALPCALSWLLVYTLGWGWSALAIPLTLFTLLVVGMVGTAVGITSTYAAYRDIFPDAGRPQEM